MIFIEWVEVARRHQEGEGTALGNETVTGIEEGDDHERGDEGTQEKRIAN